MKEIVRKVLASFIIVLMLCNSSILTLISVATDEVEDNVDTSKVEVIGNVNIEKYVNYSAKDKKGLLVKLKYKTGIEYKENQQYKAVKETLSILNTPEIEGHYPEKIEIIGDSTNDFLQKYNNESGKFAIQSENMDTAEFSINLYYNSDCYNDKNIERNLVISGFVKEKIDDSDKTEIEKQIESNFNVKDNISNLISEDISTDEIYKGFIKSNKENNTNYDTTFNENIKLKFDYNDIGNEILFENKTKLKDKENNVFDTNDVIYKNTKINKNEILDILGQDGKFQILDKDGNILDEINKDTDAQEDGSVEINYQDDVTEISIKTTRPEKYGVISITNGKAIKSSMTNVNVDALHTEISIKSNDDKNEIYSYKDENDVQLKDTETKIDMNIDNIDWTNYITNEVNFNLTLENNSAKYDLFKNPVIEIKLPEEVEKVVLGDISLLYDNGLKIKNAKVIDKDNSKVIKIELEGIQTEYLLNSIVEGPNIIIPASIILKKEIDEKQSNVSLIYYNDNVTSIDYINEDKQSKEYNINIKSINQDEPENVEQSEQISEYNGDMPVSEVNNVSFDIKATVGSKQLEENDEVYENQIIKYNIKMKNNSDNKIENVNVVGNVPDGTSYATVDYGSDYEESDDYYDLYKYVTDDSKKQVNEKISLEAGEEKQVYYEVKVSKLNNGETVKNISSNIYATMGSQKIVEYSLNNVVKNAEMSVELKSWRTEREDNLWVYDIYVYNNLNTDIKNAKFEMQLPEQFKFSEVSEDFPGKIDIDNGKVSISLDSLAANTREDLIFFVKLNETNQNANQYYISNCVVVKGDNTNTYYSNENRLTAYTSAISVVQTSDKEGMDVPYDSNIEYDFVISNVSDKNYFRDSIYVNVKDFLDENVEGVSAEYETFEQNDDGNFEKKSETIDLSEYTGEDDDESNADLDVDVEIPTGESVKLKIIVKAGVVYEKTAISNKIDLVYDNKTKSSNVIKNNIIAYNDSDNTNPKPNPDPGNDNNKKYSISGVAWIDKNSDGQMNSGEEKYSNLKVKLFNSDTGNIVKDENNNVFETTTNSDGEYKFTDVEKGNYIVLFEYDNSQYSLSAYKATNVNESVNSDVIEKEANIDGNISKVAVSDILKIEKTNIEYINIGVVPNQKFDFSLDKTITKVSMTYNGKNSEKVYQNTKLAKIEIPAKQITGTTIVVEYNIEVKNEGEIAGYINEIVDYIPEGLEFNSELNKDWFKSSDGNLRTASLAGKKIEPGETQSVKLYLTKSLTSDSMGIIDNGAEISKSSNEKDIVDIDSTAGNKELNEDDYSEAQLILAVKTGAVTYTLIIIGAILILIALKILIDKKIIKVNSIKSIKLFVFCFTALSIVAVITCSNAALTKKEVQDKLEEKYKNTTYNLRYYSGNGIPHRRPYVHHNVHHELGELYCSDGMALCGHEDHIYKFAGIKNFSSKKKESNKAGEKASMEVKSDKPSITAVNSEYNKVGPYKVKFKGSLKIKTVYASTGKVSSYKVIDVDGNATSIKSNEEFYIRIPSSVKKIVKIDVVVKTDEAVTVTEKYETKYTEIWKCNKLCKGKGTKLMATQVMNRDMKEEKEKKTTLPSSVKGTLPGTGKTEKKGDLIIQKVDDREGNTPLEGVGFTITAEINVYEFDEKITGIGCCHPSGTDVNGNTIYEHGYSGDWYNKYKQVQKTMYLTSNGKWSEDYTILYTDSDGMIAISDISLDSLSITGYHINVDGDSKELEAEYVDNKIIANEVVNNYYGYECNVESTKFEVQRGNSDTQVLPNHQKLVKLSGYVWLDGQEGKESLRNDEYDEEETGVNNIPVYLVDKSGNRIKQTTTGTYNGYSEISGGQYQFVDVDLDELEKGSYHIEFEYNGFIYEAVEPNLYENNTSKAADTNARDILNGKFTSIDGNGSQSIYTGDVRIDYGNINSHQSSIENTYNTNVIASTDEAGYTIYDDFEPTIEEIRYINLGIYKKEQTDYALTKDLYNVRVEVNGRSHIYRYGTTRYDEYGQDKDSWGDMNVKFQTNNGTYRRAIYKSDANFEQNDYSENSKGLRVYATYKIALRNESVYLGKINSIVDYCDNRFNLIKAGTMLEDDTDEIYDNIENRGKTYYDGNYSKYIVDTDILVYPEETTYVYLQFEVTNYGAGDNWRMTLASGSDIDLNNVAEIYSYTTFKDYDTNSYLAVADNDSVPGNAIPGNIDTYEDDTDAARTFKLELGKQRSIEGNVFVDGTSPEKQVAKVRLGNGKFDDGETTVKGVKVELWDTETDSPAQIFNEQYGIFEDAILDATGDDGHFEFSGYVPGNYVIKYTWGDSTYTVQYYKGTTYDKDRVNKYGEPTKNEFWYRGLVEGKFYDDTISPDVRATDAWDDKDTRIRIDQQMADLKYNTIEDEIKKAYTTGSNDITKTKMTSTTPNMEMSVECITDVTDSRDDEGIFDVNNIDFGIVERARQELKLNKRVSGYKITLANGQVLVNAKVNEDGSLSGTYPYTIWLAPQIDENGKLINKGLIKTEMDNELIEGATLEVEYTMKVENVGELDYTTWDYYYYGIVPDDSKLVTVSVEELLDYVDGRLSVVDNKWNLVGQDYLRKVNASQQNIKNELKTYITEQVKEPMTPKEPNNIRTVTLQTSKLLTSTDDNEFNNVAEITTVGKPEEPDIPKGTPVKVSGDSGGIRHFNKWESQPITIIPSTGENRDYGTPIIVGIIIITVLGVGIIIIKKFIIDK